MAEQKNVMEAQDSVSINPDLFMSLFEKAMSAGNEVWQQTKDEGIPLGEEDNATYTAIAMALKTELAESQDDVLFQSAVYRMFALLDASAKPQFSDWVRVGPGGGRDIHPALVYAAASTKMTKKSQFQDKMFMRKLKELTPD